MTDMRLVDIHAHLTFKSFKKDLDTVIKKAKDAGLIAIIDSGIDPEDFQKALDISRKYRDFVFVSLGAAPQTIDHKQLYKTIELIHQYIDKIVAIGEIGLDYYWVRDVDKRIFTQKAFRELASIAVNYDKPIVIHNRDATRDVLRILNELNAENVVFHSFMESVEVAREVIAKGWYISIPTILARSDHHKSLVRKIDLDHIMLETDSPFLSPWPRTRNEPSNVKISAQVIAGIKNMSTERVAEITTQNAVNFFKLNL